MKNRRKLSWRAAHTADYEADVTHAVAGGGARTTIMNRKTSHFLFSIMPLS